MQLDPDIRDDVTMADYESSHIMYVREDGHRKIRDDDLQLIHDALETECT